MTPFVLRIEVYLFPIGQGLFHVGEDVTHNETRESAGEGANVANKNLTGMGFFGLGQLCQPLLPEGGFLCGCHWLSALGE